MAGTCGDCPGLTWWATAGSLTGFHGVTHSILEPGGEIITYVTDLGSRVLRFDVHRGQQLPDPVLDFIDHSGCSVRTLPLDCYGYAMITASADDRHAFCTNIFTGVMSKVDLDAGRIVGQIDTGLAKPQRSLAGVAELDASWGSV